MCDRRNTVPTSTGVTGLRVPPHEKSTGRILYPRTRRHPDTQYVLVLGPVVPSDNVS